MSLNRLLFAGVAAIAFPAAASAQIANQDPGKFVQSFAATGLGALNGDKGTARAKFRSLLTQHVAVDAVGDRLIRRWRPKISAQQYAAYKAALPTFIIGTYADRLASYANADVKVVRVQNQGANAAVLTQIAKPGARPVSAIWSVSKVGGGYKVTNLTVGGVNLTMSQSADFDSYVQRNGFDALVKFMRDRA